MRPRRTIPLLALSLALSPTVRVSGAQPDRISGAPVAVVDSFFRAVEQERWQNAARFMDLDAFDALRSETVRNLRRPRTPRRVTPEELLQFDPKMPRVVAEYEAARTNEQMMNDDGLLHEYANVSNADSLAALPVEEAAARWLQAKDPRYMMRMSLAAQQARCDVPDSLITRLMRTPTTRLHVLGTVMADSLAYVLYADVPVLEGDSASNARRARPRHSGTRCFWVMPPQVLTLRRIAARWRIAPGEPFGGWLGAAFIDCSALKASQPPPPRSP